MFMSNSSLSSVVQNTWDHDPECRLVEYTSLCNQLKSSDIKDWEFIDLVSRILRLSGAYEDNPIQCLPPVTEKRIRNILAFSGGNPWYREFGLTRDDIGSFIKFNDSTDDVDLFSRHQEQAISSIRVATRGVLGVNVPNWDITA